MVLTAAAVSPALSGETPTDEVSPAQTPPTQHQTNEKQTHHKVHTL